MTTLGKILVICNFLFSLVVGFLVIIAFAVNDNWARGFQRLKGWHDISEANVKAYYGEVAAERNKATASIKERDDTIGRLQQDLQKQKDQNTLLANKNNDLILQVKNAQTGLQAATAELSRTQDELKAEHDKVVARDKKMLELEAKNKDFLDKSIRAEIAYRSAKERLETITTAMETLVKENEKMKQGGTGGLRGQLERRPPPEDVEGLVKESDLRNGLVTITLGSDQGITKGNTLFVYRLDPKPLYLGEIRILDVNAHEAVGRPIMAQRGGQIQSGDRVASNIMGQR